MTPKVNDYVRIFFRNGMQAEGNIIMWSSNRSSLALPDGKSTCIIMKTDEDIMMLQILNDISETKIGLREHFNELEEQFENTVELPSDDDLRLKKLADLKKMMIEQEKKIISEQLKDHTISTVQRPQYGTPDIFKK